MKKDFRPPILVEIYVPKIRKFKMSLKGEYGCGGEGGGWGGGCGAIAGSEFPYSPVWSELKGETRGGNKAFPLQWHARPLAPPGIHLWEYERK